MNQLTLLLTPVSLCSAAHLNSGVSASWLPHAGPFLSGHQFATEALTLVRIPLKANIERATFGRPHPWAGSARGLPPDSTLRTPLWGSSLSAKSARVRNDTDCGRNCCRVRFSTQKVHPKRSSFLWGLHVNQGLGVGSCTLIRGPRLEFLFI